MKRPKFTIAAIYDTETCNIGKGEETRAYPILFIDNDIRDVDLYEYEPDKDDKINFYRYEQEYQNRIDEYVLWGEIMGVIPVICAYNLMFDLQPLMEDLNERYEIRVNAQSSTNVYTLDLFSNGNHSLRFWDTYHLEMRGLQAMGKTCGLRKAKGSWDYSLLRTPETELTDLEYFYARRDVQVIPSYLRYLLHANEWMRQSDFGFRILTKTSIVRQMARNEIEHLTVPKRDGTRLELRKCFMSLCKKELPEDFNRYALRKACFRGGFTFTSARYALTLQRNVVSADVTSMHHTFINGRYVPQDFHLATKREMADNIEYVLSRTLEQVLDNYHKPFECAFHMRVLITGIRLRKGSVFEECGIGLESSSKFKREISEGTEIGSDPRNAEQENEVRSSGWYDQFHKAEFAFGKLYEADKIILHVSELELWTLSRVYEWDSITPLFGETTNNFKLPPDYVTLQSNKLYKQKEAAKYILAHYEKGTPYEHDVSGMPDGIAKSLRDGTMEPEFFSSWYTSTVKGMFNGIYGTMAQDVMKPQYKCEEGELSIDRETVTTQDNYAERKPRTTRILYTYGLRIVGGSRLHMVVAMELLRKHLGERCIILGGDTDSMKMACMNDVTDEEIQDALEPIAQASTKAIDRCMKRLRENFPELASGLNGIGGFEIENAGKHYELHYEMWNKARISYDGRHCHITCAGLPRPIGQYTIETFLDELIEGGNDKERVLSESIGFNTLVGNAISHTLQHHKPKCTDVCDMEVTDYRGNTSHVRAHQSVALYPSDRWLGDTLKPTNRLSVSFVARRYGRNVDVETKYCIREAETGRAILLKDTANGEVEHMGGKRC